jgi:hypothetical protein
MLPRIQTVAQFFGRDVYLFELVGTRAHLWREFNRLLATCTTATAIAECDLGARLEWAPSQK